MASLKYKQNGFVTEVFDFEMSQMDELRAMSRKQPLLILKNFQGGEVSRAKAAPLAYFSWPACHRWNRS